jgi:predicted XRE-type DNA-binding protein
LPAVGSRCRELCIVDEHATWRIVCRLDDDAVVIAGVSRRRLARPRGRSWTPAGAGCASTMLSEEEVHETDEAKRRRLAAAGWRSGDAADFLELTAEEASFLELKLALARYLRELRTRHALTQEEVARRLGSSQSRVAKMEVADASVSLDLLIRGLLALGATPEDIGRVIALAA